MFQFFTCVIAFLFNIMFYLTRKSSHFRCLFDQLHLFCTFLVLVKLKNFLSFNDQYQQMHFENSAPKRTENCDTLNKAIMTTYQL